MYKNSAKRSSAWSLNPWTVRGAHAQIGTLLAFATLCNAPALANSGPALSGRFAKADNATISASNPAGLTRLREPEFLGQFLYFSSESTFVSAPVSDPADITTDENSGSAFVPFLYYVRPLRENLTFGFSVTIPGGLGEDLDDDNLTRYLLDEWTLGYVSLAPALGYRINDRWSIGGALNINYTVYDLEAAVFNGPGQPDGRMKVEADELGLGFQLGLLYEISSRTRLGLAWRSENDSDLTDTPSFSGLTPEREAILEAAGIFTQELLLDTTLPQSIGAGVYHDWPSGRAFTFDAVWIDFSEFGLSEIRLGDTSIQTDDGSFDDIWAVTAGFSTPINEKWTLKFGAMYVSSALEDENRSMALRMDEFFGVGIGAEYKWGDNKVFGFNLNYFDLGDAPVETDVPLVGTVRGEFTSRDAIGLDLTLRWDLSRR